MIKNNVKSYLSIDLNNKWSLIDFEKLIHSLNNIYFIFYICNELIESINSNNGKIYILHRKIKFNRINFLTYIKKRKNTCIKTESLIIKRIHMESPGDIVLEGGSFLKEVREFIKDMLFRNKQEKEIGELNILEKKLQILTEYGFPNKEVEEVKLYTYKNRRNINSFINKGLLGEIIDVLI
ncbi:MAG: hypothetical protein FWD13_07615 [Treponema sp.]|nr:hypothetical protein [Treponema sp.]